MSDSETEPEPKGVDLARDMDWAYLNMGDVSGTLIPPSSAALALQKYAQEDRDKFLQRYFAFAKQRETSRLVSDAALLEDRQATMLALRKLELAVEPDVDAVLREAAKLFPDQFQKTVTALGWSKT